MKRMTKDTKQGPGLCINSILTLDQGEKLGTPLVVSGNFIYAGLADVNPGKIVKIQLQPFVKVASLTISQGGYLAKALIVWGRFLYAGLATNPARVVKIDLTSFTEVASLILDPDEQGISSFVVSGRFLYAGLATDPMKIVKIRLSDFTRVETLTYSTTGFLRNMAVSGKYLYAGLVPYAGRASVDQIDLTNFTRRAGLYMLEDSESFPNVLAIRSNYLYAGFWIPGMHGRVIKIKLPDLTIDQRLLLTQAIDECCVQSLAILSDHLYVGLTMPGKVAEIDLPSFTELPGLSVEQGGVFTLAVQLVNPANQSMQKNKVYYLYAGLETTPGQIVKIGPWSFPILDSL